jgi:tetratricopeptide (TPR) repeat protein
MLVTIREFARNRLRLMGKETELRNRHLAYFLGPARRANQELRGPNQILWLQRLEIMRDNLRSALDWAIETGQTESALELGRDLHWFWFIRGDHAEGCQWLGRVLEMPETLLYPEAQTEALTQQAHHLFLKEGERMTRPVIEQALTMAQKHRDKHNTARALVILGLVYMYENNFASAQETIEKSKALYQQVQDEWGYAHAAMCLAWNAFYQNDYESALTVNEQARTLFTAFGDKYFEVVTLRLTGYLLVKKGDWTSGMPTLREALRLAQELGSKYEIALTLWRFEEVARMAGKFIRAVHLYGATKSILDSIGALTEADQLTFEKDLAHCYSVLGELAFKDAMEEGRAMTMEESITYALSE